MESLILRSSNSYVPIGLHERLGEYHIEWAQANMLHLRESCHHHHSYVMSLSGAVLKGRAEMSRPVGQASFHPPELQDKVWSSAV